MSGNKTCKDDVRGALAKKCDDMQSEAARQLCNAIRVNLATYKPQVFWYVRKEIDPDTPLENRCATIGPCFPFKIQKPKRQRVLEQQCYPFLDHIILEDQKPRTLPFAPKTHQSLCWPLATKPFKGWISGVDARAWFLRMKPFHDKWSKNKILPFLRLASYETIPFDGALSTALLACWDPAINCFLFRWGPMTVTLADIALITGTSPTGKYGIDLPIFHHVKEHNQLYSQCLSTFRQIAQPTASASKCGFQKFVDFFTNKAASEEVTPQEEVFFLTFAFSKLMMSRAGGVVTLWLSLAVNISSTSEEIALAPILLGQLYRCLFRSRASFRGFGIPSSDSPIYSVDKGFGPLWLLTCWGHMYLPCLMVLKPSSTFEVSKDLEKSDLGFDPLLFLSDLKDCSCYGEVSFNLVSPDEVWHPSVVFLYFLVFKSNPGTWNIFPGKMATSDKDGAWRHHAMPTWLKSLDLHSTSLESGNFWSSVLRSRDLIAAEPEYFGFEAYNPQLVARQFGLVQMLAIPYFLTRNDPWTSRGRFEEGRALQSKTLNTTSMSISPWKWITKAVRGFHLWWDHVFPDDSACASALVHFESQLFLSCK